MDCLCAVGGLRSAPMGQNTIMNIDPYLGRHAAAGLTLEELRYLMNLAAVELAVRSSAGEYRDVAESILFGPGTSEDVIEEIRHERESIAFAEQVLLDIAALPEVMPQTG